MLVPAKNNVYSTLAQTILPTDTSIAVADATDFPAAGVVSVGGGIDQYKNEVIFYSGKSGNALTGCTRGYDGTTAESHAINSMVALTLVAKHIRDLQTTHGTTLDRLTLGLTLTISDTGRQFYDTDMETLFAWVKDRWAMPTISVGNVQIRDFLGDAATVLPLNYRFGDRWTDLDSPVALFRVCKAHTVTHTLADWVVIGRQG